MKLNNNEISFLIALREQHKHKGDKSFLSILYCVNMNCESEVCV